MAAVKIYGAETSRYEYFKYNLEQFLEKYNLQLQIEEIKDLNQIIKDKVLSIPTLRINAHVDIIFDEEKGIDRFISESTECILKEFAPNLLSKMLVPVDFSDSLMNALKYAIDFSKFIGSEIELFHVDHPSPLVVDGMVVVDKISKENQKYNLQRIIDQNREELRLRDSNDEFVAFKYTHKEGFAADEIIKLSEERDLVVMGTNGENTTAKKVLGSVSLKVSAKAHCPVIFVPEGKKFSGFKKIVYAYSPTSYDQKVIKDIADLARKFESTIHLVHVDDGAPFEAYDIKSYVAHMYDDIDFKYEVVEADSVSYGITHYAELVDADLIILSKKKKNLLEKILEGSQTKSTLLRASTAVMVFHNDDHGCLCGGACRQKPDSDCNH